MDVIRGELGMDVIRIRAGRKLFLAYLGLDENQKCLFRAGQK